MKIIGKSKTLIGVLLTLLVVGTGASLVIQGYSQTNSNPDREWVYTESTERPESVVIRKLGYVDDEPEPVVYLYIHRNIRTETRTDIDGESYTMYTYEMTQITVPMPKGLRNEVALEKIRDHAYSQIPEQAKARMMMGLIKGELSASKSAEVYVVDRKDRKYGITRNLLSECKAISKVKAVP